MIDCDREDEIEGEIAFSLIVGMQKKRKQQEEKDALLLLTQRSRKWRDKKKKEKRKEREGVATVREGERLPSVTFVSAR